MSRMIHRLSTWASIVLGILLVTSAMPEVAVAACGDGPNDLAALAATRDQVEATCSCRSASSHDEYVDCALGVISSSIASSDLPTPCASAAKRCARRSVCGRPGAVACFRTVAGETTCTIERKAIDCSAPEGGSVCGGLVSSCCDSCLEAACAAIPTPTPVPVCGNGVLERNEACEVGDTDECTIDGLACGATTDRTACQCCIPAGTTFRRKGGGFQPPCCNTGFECELVTSTQCVCPSSWP